MSQFWHAHWAEDSFKPTNLGNWQVPNWHPKFPCARHCATTTFLADSSGRLLPDRPKSKRSPWGDFKGTWELPLKIDRKLARQLSAPSKYKQAAWEAHKLHYQGSRGTTSVSPRKVEKQNLTKQVQLKKIVDRGTAKGEKPVARVTKNSAKPGRNLDRSHKSPFTKKPAKNVTKKERIENVDDPEDDREREKTVIEDMANGQDREEIPDDEEIVAEEQAVRKLKRGKHEEQTKSKCFCLLNSRSSVEVTPKETSKPICTIHQRLRV